MPTTLAALEAELDLRVGPRVEKAGLTTSVGADATANLSPRPYYGGPIAEGFRLSALVAASPFGATAGDVAALDDASAAKVADFAEYRLLCTCLARCTQVTARLGTTQVNNSDYAVELRQLVAAKLAELKGRYGVETSKLSAGRIRLNGGRRRCGEF